MFLLHETTFDFINITVIIILVYGSTLFYITFTVIGQQLIGNSVRQKHFHFYKIYMTKNIGVKQRDDQFSNLCKN